MSLYKLNAPLLLEGERVERGSEIELSDEQVAYLDPADITLVGAATVAEEVIADVPLAEMSFTQLKDQAKALGLAASGGMELLRERIALHLAGTSTEGEVPEEVVPTPTEGEVPEEGITNA